jgi:hypothetical protein
MTACPMTARPIEGRRIASIEVAVRPSVLSGGSTAGYVRGDP